MISHHRFPALFVVKISVTISKIVHTLIFLMVSASCTGKLFFTIRLTLTLPLISSLTAYSASILRINLVLSIHGTLKIVTWHKTCELHEMYDMNMIIIFFCYDNNISIFCFHTRYRQFFPYSLKNLFHCWIHHIHFCLFAFFTT